jgi:hypothetical protein
MSSATNSPKRKAMEQQVFKAVRLPRSVVRSIARITKADGSTFSQFMRTAAIKEVNEREKSAA